jgi:Rad3-related DNA helicase
MSVSPRADPKERLTVEDGPIDVPDVVPAFAPDGLVARALGERYRYRPQQVEMVHLVRQALVEGKTAIVEAGTGCGKSFAYLIPLVASGARAFISTANKTLQTQLWEKDIPTLQQVFPRSFTAALLKGRGNYVCRFKLREARQQLKLPGLEDDLANLINRLDEIPTGDVEDLRLPKRLCDAVTAGAHDCLRNDCPDFVTCYYERAKLRAEEADIVVVNHALLAYNLVSPFLSSRPVVVVDEAHELERYTVHALCLGIEYATVPQFVNDAVVLRHAADDLRQEAIRLNHSLFTQLAEKPDRERRWAVQGELPDGLALADRIDKIHKVLLQAYPPVPVSDDEDEEGNAENAQHQARITWAVELANVARELAEEPPPDQVRYCEADLSVIGPGSVVLCREPIQVAGFLQEALFDPVKRVICTGATLAVAGSAGLSPFDYFRRQTGAPGEPERAVERVLGSPFDYARQALLYTPNGLVPQYGAGEEEYVLNLGREIWRLLKASCGRAFVLCTSSRRMNELYDLISPHLDYTCYCQGNGLSRAELLELFQSDLAHDGGAGAVLFATKSFWEGVDIPGPALSLVIIDKLPFSPHRDPVVQYRQQAISDRGGRPFDEMTLPEAILALKQGVGRLIRTETDRGVIAILDSRINTKRYGQQIIASLPRARRTRRIGDVRRFFDRKVQGRVLLE